MIFSGVAFCVWAAISLAVGLLGGWLLRGHFQSQPVRGNCQVLPVSYQRVRGSDGFAGQTTPRPDFVCAEKVSESHDGAASTPSMRKTFSLALRHRLAESTRSGDPLSLILARIDNYENIADRGGLQRSNELLDAVGKFFIASVRGMDWVARFDAATFAFLLPNTAHAGALHVADRLRTTTSAASPTLGAAQVRLTLSLGTTEFMLGDTGEAILCRAEDAMNAAFRAGGNCIRSYVVGQLETADVA
jgi:diguanylate cyclase (GGDEF)-like protein